MHTTIFNADEVRANEYRLMKKTATWKQNVEVIAGFIGMVFIVYVLFAVAVALQ